MRVSLTRDKDNKFRLWIEDMTLEEIRSLLLKLLKKDNAMRSMLLQLVQAAPSPVGFEKAIPHYQATWDAARQLLRETCPAHIDDNGTCPNCHADMPD